MDINKNTNNEVVEEPAVELEEVSNDSKRMAVFENINVTTQAVSRRHLPQWALAWIVMIPALIFLFVFMVYPIINTFIMAFLNQFSWVQGGGSFSIANIIRAFALNGTEMLDGTVIHIDIAYPGIENFVLIFRDQFFLNALLNTFIIVLVSVPLTIIIALLISGLLNSIKVLRGTFQTIFFLPYVTNTLALGIVFNAIFNNTSSGIANSIIHNIGQWFGQSIDPIDWVTTPYAKKHFAGIVIILYGIWNGLAFKILVFMGGLATIDKQYYDAAKVDGASGGTIFRRITLPLLSPQILYITITSFIGAFKAFTGVRAVFADNRLYYFGGTNMKQWMTVVGYVYELMQNGGNMGMAAAGSVTLLVIILIITGLQFLVSKTRVHY